MKKLLTATLALSIGIGASAAAPKQQAHGYPIEIGRAHV